MPNPILLVFPAELPDSFFEELDCLLCETRFAAFHCDPVRGRLVRENGASLKSCPNAWVFAALLAYPPVLEWCRQNHVHLERGDHWLIWDYGKDKAYIADPETARECLTKQRLPKKPKVIHLRDTSPNLRIVDGS